MHTKSVLRDNLGIVTRVGPWWARFAIFLQDERWSLRQGTRAYRRLFYEDRRLIDLGLGP
jgi:hypothetical protein